MPKHFSDADKPMVGASGSGQGQPGHVLLLTNGADLPLTLRHN